MSKLRNVGHRGLVWIQDIGLLLIAIFTVVAMVMEVIAMVAAQTITLADLLLLFIYLEVFAMVAIYLDSGKLPVRMPLYIAMVALARYLILDMKNLDTWRIVGIAGAALLIAIAILAVRYGHARFPYHESDEH